jgi:hypothetical protein
LDGWDGQPGRLTGLLGQGGRVHQRPPYQVGVPVIHAGGGQELIQQPLQLLALPVGHPEQLLLLLYAPHPGLEDRGGGAAAGPHRRAV